MSSPPEYQSLTQHDPDEHNDSKTRHTYPPNDLESGGGGESSSSSSGVTLVNYKFVPRYPVKGSPQDALGVLYPSQEATARSLQNVFPTLAEYDLDRIEILAQMGDSKDFGVIMPDAWKHIVASQTKTFKVQVKDLPGDEKRRSRHCCAVCLTGTVMVLGLYALVVLLIYLLVRKAT